MNLKLLLLLGGVCSDDYFDSGQDSVDFRFTEISQKGEKRVLLDEKFQVSSTDEETPKTKSEQLKQQGRRPGFMLPNQRGENRHYNQDRRIKPSRRPKKPKRKVNTNRRTQPKEIEIPTTEPIMESSGDESLEVETNYNYDYSNYDGDDDNYDYDYEYGNSSDFEARRKKPTIEFRVNADKECRVLPSNCNPDKFNFVDCTNDNKYVWQNKDKCKFISTQDQAWRWRSVMCKCRRSTEDRKVKCSLETAFEYKKFDRLNAKNKTVHIGKWQAFRRDNGRLDWRPVAMSTPCGNIGRAVSHCPKFQDKPFYIDLKDDDETMKFGAVARMKCPNKIVKDEVEEERVWKIKCGVGEWFHENGTSINHVDVWNVCQTQWGAWGEWGSCSSSCDGGKITRTRQCFYKGECANTDKDIEHCTEGQAIKNEFCQGGEEASLESDSCNDGVKCIQWASWSRWTRPDNKCEGKRFRQCQNCLADGTCTPIPKFKQSCQGDRMEIQYFINKPACKYFLSIEHGGNITIFDTRRGKMNTLEGGIKGMPQRSPFVRTDCTIKHGGEIYVVGAVKGVEQMSLYKTDRETSKWRKAADLPHKVFRSSCESFEGRLWRCGGFMDSTKQIRSKRCYSYSLAENTWRRERDMNNERATHSMVRLGSSLYIFGGSGVQPSTGEIYETKNDVWGVFAWSVDQEPTAPVVISSKNTKKQRHVNGDQIWFAGGATKETASDQIWRYTPKDNRMVKMGRMLKPRFRVALLFSARQLDRNAAGRGRHQLMVDGGLHPDGKNIDEELTRELCDIWEWTEQNAEGQVCQGVDRLDVIPPHTASVNWP